MKTSLTLLILFSFLFALVGCKTVNIAERASPQSSPNLIDDERIESDRQLTRSVAIESINESVAGGDLLQVQVTVRNTTRRRAQFAYQFEWIDERGMAVRSPSPVWRPAQLLGGETRAFSAVAPRSEVVDFRFKIIRN